MKNKALQDYLKQFPDNANIYFNPAKIDKGFIAPVNQINYSEVCNLIILKFCKKTQEEFHRAILNNEIEGL